MLLQPIIKFLCYNYKLSFMSYLMLNRRRKNNKLKILKFVRVYNFYFFCFYWATPHCGESKSYTYITIRNVTIYKNVFECVHKRISRRIIGFCSEVSPTTIIASRAQVYACTGQIFSATCLPLFPLMLLHPRGHIYILKEIYMYINSHDNMQIYMYYSHNLAKFLCICIFFFCCYCFSYIFPIFTLSLAMFSIHTYIYYKNLT